MGTEPLSLSLGFIVTEAVFVQAGNGVAITSALLCTRAEDSIHSTGFIHRSRHRPICSFTLFHAVCFQSRHCFLIIANHKPVHTSHSPLTTFPSATPPTMFPSSSTTWFVIIHSPVWGAIMCHKFFVRNL